MAGRRRVEEIQRQIERDLARLKDAGHPRPNKATAAEFDAIIYPELRCVECNVRLERPKVGRPPERCSSCSRLRQARIMRRVKRQKQPRPTHCERCGSKLELPAKPGRGRPLRFCPDCKKLQKKEAAKRYRLKNLELERARSRHVSTDRRRRLKQLRRD